METVRNPAVANMFYPGDANELRHMVESFLDDAQQASSGDSNTHKHSPKAIVAPHAGYIYSGPVAASAYTLLTPVREQISRVVLLGPSHRVPLLGCACSSADYFATPLGNIAIDRNATANILTLPFVKELDQAHALEHSLEVHLPFLQAVLKEFVLVPVVVGDCEAEQVAQLLEMLWGGPETLIVVSSDLSHYHDYNTAKQMDSATCHAIEELDYQSIDSNHACGMMPLRGLLYVAKHHGMHAATVDCRNSGDTAGPKNQVVGYGSYVFE
ncbi:AmmeMemoRadiSam system protein B [Kaarinaea lacus]